LWCLSENRSEWMLDYWSLYDLQHICASCFTKSGLFWNPRWWVYVWYSWCSSFFCSFWFILFKNFWVFVFFRYLIYFFTLILFLGCFRIKPRFLGRFMIEQKIPGPLGRVDLVCHIFVKWSFGLKVCLANIH
jgi:hypothetical protein